MPPFINRLSADGTLKQCTLCEQYKPLEDFHNSPGKQGGKQSRCKRCVRIRSKWSQDGQTIYNATFVKILDDVGFCDAQQAIDTIQACSDREFLSHWPALVMDTLLLAEPKPRDAFRIFQSIRARYAMILGDKSRSRSMPHSFRIPERELSKLLRRHTKRV